MMVLNSGYRSPLTFNEEVIGQAERALERLGSGLKPAQTGVEGIPDGKGKEILDQVEKTRQVFEAAMDDDFNTAGALGHLFDLVRAINQARADGATDEQLSDAQATLRKLCGVFGLRLADQVSSRPADAFVDLLMEVRAAVREQKMWPLSDLIRDRLSELGVEVEDGKDSSSWVWK
jgi:cysteinyl-tRNA synthetase